MGLNDLFAGAGGTHIGAVQAGLKTRLAVEWEPTCCAVLRAIGAEVHEGDVRGLHQAPRAALWWASPPCQAWSSAGKRKGAADARNGWPWVWDLFDRTPAADRPRWLLCENVAGMTHHLSRAGCERGRKPNPGACSGCYLRWVIIPQLSARFRYVEARILDAADYGVPQRRRRLIVACGPEPYRWPAPTHSGVALARAKWVSGDYWREHGMAPPETEPSRWERAALRQAADGLPRWRTVRDALEAALSTIGAGPEGQGALAQSARTLRPDEPSPVVDAGLTGDSYRAPCVFSGGTRLRRRLSVEECAILQGFPPDHPWCGTKAQQYAQVGNAVPPPLAAALLAMVPRCAGEVMRWG